MQSGQPATPVETGLRGLSCQSRGAPRPPQSTSCDRDAPQQPHLWNRIYARLYPADLWKLTFGGFPPKGKKRATLKGDLKLPHLE